MISKNVGSSSSSADRSRTPFKTSVSSEYPTICPFTWIRSRRSNRCGDVNVPTAYPHRRSMADSIATVDPLPFDPAIWTKRTSFCGSPIAFRSFRIRSRLNVLLW